MIIQKSQIFQIPTID